MTYKEILASHDAEKFWDCYNPTTAVIGVFLDLKKHFGENLTLHDYTGYQDGNIAGEITISKSAVGIKWDLDITLSGCGVATLSLVSHDAETPDPETIMDPKDLSVIKDCLKKFGYDFVPVSSLQTLYDGICKDRMPEDLQTWWDRYFALAE